MATSISAAQIYPMVYNKNANLSFSEKEVSDKMSSFTVLFLQSVLGDIFDVVSQPLQYKGTTIYFMAARINNEDYKFTFYAVDDCDSFLASPDLIPEAFEDQEFMFNAVDKMGLDNVLQSGRYFSLSRVRLIPDLPICRLTLQQVQQNNPDLIFETHLIEESGKIISASSIIDMPVMLS